MSVLGSPSDWAGFLERMMPDILRLIVDAWEALSLSVTDDREDEITEVLCRALRQNRAARELPVYVQIQMVELDPVPGQELGRLDIAFLPSGLSGSPNESIYFCLECKRLSVVKSGRRRAYASEYVLHGMLRFVSGQYARAVRHGGMLGYVLDGDVDTAIANVEANVRRHFFALGMDAPGLLLPSSILTGKTKARESTHRRVHESAQFMIHHLFVSGKPLAVHTPGARP